MTNVDRGVDVAMEVANDPCIGLAITTNAQSVNSLAIIANKRLRLVAAVATGLGRHVLVDANNRKEMRQEVSTQVRKCVEATAAIQRSEDGKNFEFPSPNR